MANSLTTTWRTHAGKVAKVVVLVAAAVIDPSGAVVQAIRNAIEALTTGKTTRATITKVGTASVTPATGAYEDDQDKVFLTFLGADGQTATIKIPAPNPAIFSDGENVNLGHASVIAFRDWVLANAKTQSGAAFTALLRGRRGRLESGKRF